MIKPPSQKTLDKYGLSEYEWMLIAQKQDFKCAVCGVPFDGSRRVNTDHFHVKNWKKMNPGDRKKYVRGLLCFVCNYLLLMRGVTIERLQNAVDYLKLYEERKPE